MNNETQSVSDKKSGKGNGNSVINNYEHTKNKANDYVSGDSFPTSSGKKFDQTQKQ